jgi:hypothetical protein
MGIDNPDPRNLIRWKALVRVLETSVRRGRCWGGFLIGR